MPIEADFLTLAQWFSPAYPVGAFAYSHGLEAMVARGAVADPATLETWVREVLALGAGRSDAMFLAAAYHAKDGAAVDVVDAMCRAFAASRERVQETVQQGAAFGRITMALTGAKIFDLAYPVAVGVAARHQALPLELTTQMYLQAFAANVIAAGQRLAAIGQTEAQQILQNLIPLCIDLAQDTRHGDLEQLSSTAFVADIAAMHHETQYSRIFRT